MVGTKKFNAGTATKITYLTNPLIYWGILSTAERSVGLENFMKVGLMYLVVDTIGRVLTDVIVFGDRTSRFENSLCFGYRPKGYTLTEAKRIAGSTLLSGSLAGKLLSLPIEYGMSLYDRVTGDWRNKEKKGE